MPKAICSKCRASHKVAEKYSGKTITCLKCGTNIIVPAVKAVEEEVIDLREFVEEEHSDDWNLDAFEDEGVTIPKRKKNKKTTPVAEKRKPYRPDPIPLMPVLIGVLTLLIVGLGIFVLTRKAGDGKSLLSHLSRIGEEDKTEERMKAIAAGMYKFEDTHRFFPFSFNAISVEEAAIKQNIKRDDLFDTPPRLSWRVHLLPYVGETVLYNQFHLDEAWDSPHNKTLLSKTPQIYLSRGDTPEAGMTRFQLFTSKDKQSKYAFKEWIPAYIRHITDGTANTILVAESGSDKAVTWTQPVDMEIDPDAPFACLGKVTTPSYAVVMFMGDFHWLRKDVSADLMLAMLTSCGGEDINSLVEALNTRKKRR